MNTPLDWHDEFATDYSRVDWLPGKLAERGQQVAILGSGKVGKSILVFEWAWRAATGQPFLAPVDCGPLKIVYCDRENSRRDLVMRAKAMGATPADLANVIYYSFPTMLALNVDGSELLNLADRAGADVVVLDTVSRFVNGPENDAETWLNLYRQVHAKLKAVGRAGIRLDHFGKDASAGGRGSSAKEQDIDTIWELTQRGAERDLGNKISTDLRLLRTHTRTGVGPSVIDVIRKGQRDPATELWVDGKTGHVLAAKAHSSGTEDLPPRVREAITKLDAAGIEATAGREALKNESANAGLQIRLSNADWGTVAKIRKDTAQTLRARRLEPPPTPPPSIPGVDPEP